MTNHTTALDLDDIETRAAHLYEYGQMDSQDGQNALDQLTDTDVPALLAEVRRLRDRVAELERPAVEAKRAEIRSSYVELSAQAEQDRDYEGAFDVQCRLREREEQWAREDAAVSAVSGAADSRQA